MKPIILDNFGQWEETLALMEQKTGLSLAEIARAAFLEKAKHFREHGFVRFGPGSAIKIQNGAEASQIDAGDSQAGKEAE